MTLPFHSIVSYEEDSWEQFLEQIMLIDIFMPVIKHYENKDTLKCVIRYIAYAYSLNSDKIILGMEWQKNKQQIFEFVLAKPEKTIYEDLVLLKSAAVLETIHRWLEFQENDTFKMVQTLKDLRIEMQLSSVSNIKKASLETDYDQKFKNAEYANKLKLMIKDLEAELVQNDHRLKDAVREVNIKKSKDTLHVERFAK